VPAVVRLRVPVLPALAFLLLNLTACSTYRSYDLDGCRVFGGVRYDCGDTAEKWSADTAPWPTVMAILSFPFSLLEDTVFLPGTLLHALIYGEQEPWNR
jgi:uncharacterized protein YceK